MKSWKSIGVILAGLALGLCPMEPGQSQTQQLFQRTEIPSSFNPVGSGARALGMGGAFIAVADDATAASWNPGGLIQLERPEISAVGAYLHRIDDISFGVDPGAGGPQSVSNVSLNYLSAAFPFALGNRNMIVSLNYQHLFDFNREWDFFLRQRHPDGSSMERRVDFDLDGGLYALGLAYSVQVSPFFSLGITFNFWEDFLYDNEWTKKTREVTSGRTPLRPRPGGGTTGGVPFALESRGRDEFSFSGFNVNLGLLWRLTEKFTVGAVFKSPFEADLEHRSTELLSTSFPTYPQADTVFSSSSFREEKLDMPMSYGIGLSYRFSDTLTVSADVHRTHWDQFTHTSSEGDETSPISGLPKDDSDIDATHQFRMGAEYLVIKPKYVVPVRWGFFYDPAPAEGGNDDFFGLTAGSGIGFHRFSWDFAYQYRFGRNTGSSILKGLEFAEDQQDHTLFTSVIFYF